MNTQRPPSKTLNRTQRLTKLIRRRVWKRVAYLSITIVVLLAAAIIPLVVVPKGVRWLQASRDMLIHSPVKTEKPPAVEFSRDASGDVILIRRSRWNDIGIKIEQVSDTPPPKPLTMDGVLYLDPDDYAPVRTRFGGEVIEVAQLPDNSSHENKMSEVGFRGLRFGDDVKKGQLLAVVWSRELGEKKSELAETLSALEFDRETLKRLGRNEGVVPLATIRESERRVRQGEISLDRIEKTLRSWQLSAQEIEDLRKDLESASSAPLSKSQIDASSVSRWARVELHSPIDGTIVEKNISVGALVDNDHTLFKVANLDHLDIRAFAYEEDLLTLQQIAPEDRHWSIRIKGDRLARPIEGSFDRIGSLIDPIQHTGLVMGWVDNAQRQLRAGQFVSATVALPETQTLLSVPANSIADLDGHTFVLIKSDLGEDHFWPLEVKVARYQANLACIVPDSVGERSIRLSSNHQILSAGAVEILAEYRLYNQANSHVSNEGGVVGDSKIEAVSDKSHNSGANSK